MFIQIAILLTLFSVAYLWVKRRFSYWKDRGFVQGEPTFPWGTFKGTNTERTLAEQLDYYYKKHKGNGPAIGLYNFLSPFLIPTDPELIKNIFVRDFQSFPDRAFFHNKVGQFWNGIFNRLTVLFIFYRKMIH
jgi:cytochrome P450 family 6